MKIGPLSYLAVLAWQSEGARSKDASGAVTVVSHSIFCSVPVND